MIEMLYRFIVIREHENFELWAESKECAAVKFNSDTSGAVEEPGTDFKVFMYGEVPEETRLSIWREFLEKNNGNERAAKYDCWALYGMDDDLESPLEF